MYKIATRIFTYASILFGVLGILVVLSMPGNNQESDDPNIFLMKLLMATGFVVLSSFALSVAGKYLDSKS